MTLPQSSFNSGTNLNNSQLQSMMQLLKKKIKKKKEKKRTLSPSRVMGGKQFEQFCSTDRGNVSFANSSGVLAPQEHSQAQEVSHKPETEAWWGRNLSVSHLALQKLSKLLLTLNFKF